MPTQLSTITITFNNLVSIDQFVSFDWGLNTPSTAIETFKAYRSQAGEIAIPFDAQVGYLMTGEEAAIAYVSAFQVDWDPFGLMTLTRNGKVVTIEIQKNWTFYNDNGSTAAGVVINNGSPQTFTLDTYQFLPGPSACASVDLRLNTSEQIVKYKKYPNTEVDITPTTQLDINYIRLLNYGYLRLYNAAGDEINVMETIPYIYVGTVIAKNIEVDITNGPGGATVTVTPTFPGQSVSVPALVLDYSIDGTNFQTSNIFSGQLPGSYTVHVRDQFGCIRTSDYVVDEYVSNAKPIFYISKNNSITFSKNEVWDGQAIMKNDNNVLSESDIPNVLYKENLLFQTSDASTIQFKSNYDNHTVTLERGCDGPDSNIVVAKQSNNIGRFASMECTIYEYKKGLAGLYFISGDTYDNGGTANGSYVLNGNLPDFAIVGQYVNIVVDDVPAGTFEIINVVYDSKVEKRAIIINYTHSGEPKAIKVNSTYNLLEYEVYELLIDWSLYPEDDYRVKIEATRTGFDTQEYYSENVLLRDKHDKTVAIHYWGEGNTDIFYAYGITHFIRVYLDQVQAYIEDEDEVVKGDSVNTLVDSEIYDGNKFKFEALTRDCFLKLCIALSSPNLFINGIGYVKKGGLEYENIENTNLYVLEATLLKSGDKINESVADPSINAPVIYVPNTLAGSTGLIKL